MGLVRTEIELSNPRDAGIRPLRVMSLVDTGALHPCVPEQVAIKFENRACFTGALVFGNEVLLGAVPMEDLDVLASPATRTLIVDPASLNILGVIACASASTCRMAPPRSLPRGPVTSAPRGAAFSAAHSGPHFDSEDCGALNLGVTRFGVANDHLPYVVHARDRAARGGLTARRIPLDMVDVQAEASGPGAAEGEEVNPSIERRRCTR